MTEITISLREDQLQALTELAERLGLSVENLAKVGLEDMLGQPDVALEQALDRVLSKNRDLYQRLA